MSTLSRSTVPVGASGVPLAVAADGPDDLTVVAPVGVLDRGALTQLDEVVAQTAGSTVVIDLTDCVLASTVTAAALDVRRWTRPAGDVCIVCRRRSGRRLLARVGVALPVFGSLQDARQALVLREAGYGRGWS